MSMSPHQIFGRLQELKKWQQTHEKLLKRASYGDDFEKTSFNHAFSPNGSRNSNENSFKNPELPIPQSTHKNTSPDRIKGSPDKNFEELLEEKINEYTESINPEDLHSTKAKKPFLRKGTGLLKYNLKPEEYKKLIGNKYSNTILIPKGRPKSVEVSKKPTPSLPNRPKTSGGEKTTNYLRKPHNSCRKSNRTSVKSARRPQTSGGEYSRNKENPDVQNFAKDDKNARLNPSRNAINFEKNENHQGLKFQNVQASVLNTRRPMTVGGESIKKTSPKLHDFIEKISSKPVENLDKKHIEFTPLKAPEISIKPKGNWCDISVNKLQNDKFSIRNASAINFQNYDINQFNDKYTTQVVVQSQWKNGVVKQINEFTSKMSEIGNVNNLESNFQEEESCAIQNGARKSLSFESNEQSLYEKALETELMIFEALERRTEQSGFCSTNTSILQLLASTPSKFNVKNISTDTDSPLVEKDKSEEIENQPVRDRDMVTVLSHKGNVETPSEDTSPLHNLQLGSITSSNWSMTGQQVYETEEDEEVQSLEDIDHTIKENEDINEEKPFEARRSSSVDSENLGVSSADHSIESSDISDEYTEGVERDYRNSQYSQPHRMNLDMSESCTSCGCLIRNKIEECQSELNNLKMEKNRIIAIREQMAREKKDFEKEMKTRRRQFEEQRLKFQLELEEEKKRISEKQLEEKPSKEAKSKNQHKKDKEEISNLKIELNETKELMKLRETKNAMSLARLRNQVKLLEKNNAELKVENEKLLKEKSKLAAQQKSYNKSTETKMLKEISKNISKLTEETFKNQCFKADTSSEDDLKKKLLKSGCNGDSENCGKSLNYSEGSRGATLCHGHGEGVIEKKSPLTQSTHNGIGDRTIEEKYHSLFGGQEVIIEDGLKNKCDSGIETIRPVGLGKSERILEDGTKEIRYSNGNMKLVSENGTVRYYYASNDTWHTNFPDGSEVLEFPNGQSEKRFKDGKCLVFFPDGLVQTIFPDGTEEVKYPDGSKLLTKKDGDRMLFLSNGQVEIHTKDQKRREYPDGTVKILYPDGSQETRYSNGRIRIKNSEGDIILDTGERSN